MTTSQDTAKAVALKEIGIDPPTAVQVAYVDPKGPAKNSLLVRDIFKEVDGQPVTTPDQIVAAVKKHKDLTNVEFRIERDKKETHRPGEARPAGRDGPGGRHPRPGLRVPLRHPGSTSTRASAARARG
nr:PDZ domain-containing protein [Nocardioides convexus]